MAQTPGLGVHWLIGLMATQFLVHAVGWAMTAAMQRRADGVEAHFAASWATLALALGLYLLPQPAAWYAVADWLLLAATLLLHRGVQRFYHQPAPDGRYLAVALGVALLLALASLQADAWRWRMLILALAPPLGFAALAWSFWRYSRRRRRLWATAVAAKALLFSLLALLTLQGWQAFDAGVVIGLFFVGGLFNLIQVRLVLGRVLRHLLAQTQLDPLTGAANRRGFMLALERAHRHALHGGPGYALLMVDIDHFKRVNDERGHAAGDQVLRDVARALLDGVRSGDAVGRLGGEEFCLLLPASDAAGAAGLAQRLCHTVAGTQGLTISIGVALVDATAESAEAALARADAALYQAKNEGRNRVVVANPAGPGSLVKVRPTC